jgi:hypothetical protein
VSIIGKLSGSKVKSIICRQKSRRVYPLFDKSTLLIVCLLLASLFYLHAEESAKSYLIFLETACITRTGDDQRLKNLLTEAAVFDLQQRGFTTLTAEEWQKAGVKTDDQTVTSSPPRDSFAQLTIKAVYAENGKDLTIIFDWQNKGRRTDTYSKTSQLNDNLLYLDKLITDAITEITTKLGIKVIPANPKKITKPNGQKSKEAEQAPERNVKYERSNQPHKLFELTVSASPFVPAGEATRITQLGLLGACTASCLLNFDNKFELALGLYGACNYFETTEAVLAVPIMYIPLGIDLRFIIHSYLPFAFYLRVSGGPAFNLLFLDPDAPVNRLTAYALGGIGLTIALCSSFGLGLDSNFILFFESATPLMGFHPAAIVYCRI